jgi:hypothetical protein
MSVPLRPSVFIRVHLWLIDLLAAEGGAGLSSASLKLPFFLYA